MEDDRRCCSCPLRFVLRACSSVHSNLDLASASEPRAVRGHDTVNRHNEGWDQDTIGNNMATMAGQRMTSLPSMTSPSRIAITKPRRTAFSTATRTAKHCRLPTPHQRPCIVARIPPKSLAPSSIIARHASSSPTTSTQTPAPEDVLTWDRFFDLRKKRRYLNLGSSIVTAAGAIGIFGPVLAQQDLDSWAAQVSGLDPLIVLGLTSFAVAAGGWLCGPSVGNLGFKAWAGRRGWNRGIAEVSLPEEAVLKQSMYCWYVSTHRLTFVHEEREELLPPHSTLQSRSFCLKPAEPYPRLLR